jgi:hypothetical protein
MEQSKRSITASLDEAPSLGIMAGKLKSMANLVVF